MAGGGIVTLLFTDLVGSTELLDRLGDVAAEQVRRAHFTILRDALAERGGQEVKNLGDGLMVVFPSASDAVACAVAMQQSVGRYNRGASGHSIEVRVGLHVGEPIRDEGDFFGTPVVVAKRLCDRASGGQIVASALVRELVVSRGEHEFAPLGPLTLKGLSEPIAAFEVAWSNDRPDAPVELPASLIAGEATSFVARDLELGRLVDAWASARKGASQLVVVSGEPGVGKTRLAAELARVAHVEGATVLHGRCYEEGVVPYQPFVEALRPLVATYTAEDLRAAVPIGLPELARLLPELGPMFPSAESLRAEPDAERFRLFEAVRALLDVAGGDRGLVVVLDDLHWADKPTLVLLQHLVHQRGSGTLQLVGTYRDTELAPTHPLADTLGALRRDGNITRVALHGLDEAGVGALLHAWAGHEPEVAFVHAVFEETEGNPFFVNEVVQHLAETGAIYRKDGEWVSDLGIDQLGIPEGVREVVGRRLASLGDDNIKVLAAAAIAGREFDAAIVAHAAAIDEGAVLDTLDRATRGGLVHEVAGTVGGFAFSHALVQETLRHDIGTARRAFLHRKVGEAIEVRHAHAIEEHLGELAFHFGEAAAGDASGKAVDYACRAGDRAQRLLAYEDAAAMFERALQALDLSGHDDLARRSEIAQRLGTACGWANQPVRAWAALDEATRLARQVGDPELIARAATEYADFPDFSVERTTEAAVRLEEALAALPPEDSFLRARVMILLGFSVQMDPILRERGAGLLREGLEMARRIDAPVLQVAAITSLTVSPLPEALDEAIELGREAHDLAVTANDPESAIFSRSQLAVLCVIAGRLVEAREHVAQAGAANTAAGGRMFNATFVFGNQVMLELLAGHFAPAEQLIEKMLDAGGGLANPLTAQRYGVAISRVRGEQGRLAELEPLVRQLVDTSGAPGWRARLGAMYVELGRIDDARAQLEQLATLDLEVEARSIAWLITAAYLAEIARALDATELAATLLPLLAPQAGQAIVVLGVACNGSIDRHLGLLSATLHDWAAAVTHFERALAMNRDLLESPPLTARTQVDYARTLLDRDTPGDHEHARSLLDDAIATTSSLGMHALGPRAVALLDTLSA